ncbi:MAG: efflux RND transporter periplasmic adaptor subunit [Polyangiales bacterium]
MSEPSKDDLGFALPEPAKLSPTRAVAIGALVIAVLGGAIVMGVLPRQKAREALAAEKSVDAGPPRVEVIAPKVLSSDRSIVLPGSVQPLEETTLYPRATGYVSKWYFDMGDTVKEGELLADIDTPEADRELSQARASLLKAEAGILQAKAVSEKADTELDRSKKLLDQGLTSKQDLDQKQADATVGHANVKVAEAAASAERANVARLVQLKAYSKIIAPFAGRITMRGIERGALVSAGSATTPLFKLAAIDLMRVYVNVPQGAAPGVKLDLPAKVIVREFPTKPFEGKIAHTAGSLDPTTRTMLTEVRVPNADHSLLAGMYASVSLTLPVPHRVLEIPATALITDGKGTRVAIVDAASKIHLVPVVIERDTGSTFELSSGIESTDRVVRVANVDLTEGRLVDVAPPPAAPH